MWKYEIKKNVYKHFNCFSHVFGYHLSVYFRKYTACIYFCTLTSVYAYLFSSFVLFLDILAHLSFFVHPHLFSLSCTDVFVLKADENYIKGAFHELNYWDKVFLIKHTPTSYEVNSLI